MAILEERAKVPIRMTYRAVGSGTGQKEFKGEDGKWEQLGNFGAGDIPFGKADYDAMQDRGQEMMHIPIVMGAISFFHSIPSSLPLDLNACLLAKIFNVQITMWDDAEILNFGNNQALASVLAGQEIKVVRRVFGSSSTSISTSYLKTATEAQGCAADWPDTMVGKGDADKATLAPTKAPFWDAKTNAAQGSGGVASFLADNEFAIGYLDAGHGISEGFNEVALQNKAGEILTSQDADLAAAAGFSTLPSELTADWSAASLLDAPGATSWPMMTFSYLYVKKDMSGMGESGGLVRALVEFLLSEEGQGYLAEFGFIKVPEMLVAKGLAAVAAATYAADIKVWEFEDASTTIAYGGTASHIFSGKRQNWNTYVLGSLSGTVDSHVQVRDDESSDTTAAIEALTAQVLALQAASQSAGESTSDANEDMTATVDKANQAFGIGVAALVITLVYAVGMTMMVKELQHKVSVLERVGAAAGNSHYSENSSQKSLVVASGPL